METVHWRIIHKFEWNEVNWNILGTLIMSLLTKIYLHARKPLWEAVLAGVNTSVIKCLMVQPSGLMLFDWQEPCDAYDPTAVCSLAISNFCRWWSWVDKARPLDYFLLNRNRAHSTVNVILISWNNWWWNSRTILDVIFAANFVAVKNIII